MLPPFTLLLKSIIVLLFFAGAATRTTSAVCFGFRGTTFANVYAFFDGICLVVLVFAHKFVVNLFQKFLVVHGNKSFVFFVARKLENNQFVGIYSVFRLGRLKKNKPLVFIIYRADVVKFFDISVLAGKRDEFVLLVMLVFDKFFGHTLNPFML